MDAEEAMRIELASGESGDTVTEIGICSVPVIRNGNAQTENLAELVYEI